MPFVVVLSPAKTLDLGPVHGSPPESAPLFPKEAAQLAAALRKLPAPKIKALMKVSDKIAADVVSFYEDFDDNPAKQAALAFDGPSYRAFSAGDMSGDDIEFAQSHVRILCGLYGVLRPMDMIKPYRLEMGCKLAVGSSKDLYGFWGDSISNALLADIRGSKEGGPLFIVNCASEEYWKSVALPPLEGVQVITMKFPGPSVYAKQARGGMVRYIVKNRVTSPEGLKGFTGAEGEWTFSPAQSGDTEFHFVRGGGGAGAAGGKKSKGGKRGGAAGGALTEAKAEAGGKKKRAKN